MDKTTINEIILFLKSSLLKINVTVNSIVLFGSAASNKMTIHSDLDIIIVSPDFDGKDLFERSEITMLAEIKTMKKFQIPMDIINLSPEEYAEAGSYRYYPSKIVA
jgi:predicted nucleotidyltransferase